MAERSAAEWVEFVQPFRRLGFVYVSRAEVRQYLGVLTGDFRTCPLRCYGVELWSCAND